MQMKTLSETESTEHCPKYKQTAVATWWNRETG